MRNFVSEKVALWLVAYDALKTMQATSSALDFKQISRFLDSLDVTIDMSKRYPGTNGSFLGTALTYKSMLQKLVSDTTADTSGTPSIPDIDTSTIRKMERNLGSSNDDTCNFVACEKQHPYDSSAHGGCPECGMRVEMTEEVYAQMSLHLKENDFLTAMRNVSAEAAVSTKTQGAEADSVGEGAMVPEVEVQMSNEEKFLMAMKNVGSPPVREDEATEVDVDNQGGLQANQEAWVIVEELQSDEAADGAEEAAEATAGTDEEKFLAAMRKVSV